MAVKVYGNLDKLWKFWASNEISESIVNDCYYDIFLTGKEFVSNISPYVSPNDFFRYHWWIAQFLKREWVR